tara:strand:+ start:774 stop:1418 length:645 start_codon:yes stop_codon:yes gene_type:complete
MGFLDHSTNNIIVDAVLTDVGRQKLADATSSENFVASYAFADDEIDYTMIKKYGTIVGKEKIEKNTPVFEASTNAELGVKYFLSTSANPIVAQATLAATITSNVLNRTSTETSLTLSMTDTSGILTSVAYDIFYDPRFIAPLNGEQTKNVPNNLHRKMLSVEAGLKEDLVLKFIRGNDGREVLAKRGETTEVTVLTIKPSSGPKQTVSIKVEYN